MTASEIEFGDLFLAEAEQRLDRLDTELLQLEAADVAATRPLIDSLFRDAHTLKGAAAVLGYVDLTGLLHAMEDVFEVLRSGQQRPSTETVEVLLATVETLHTLIPAAVAGEDYAGEAERMKAQLLAVRPGSPQAVPVPVPAPKPPAPPAQRAASEPMRVAEAESVVSAAPPAASPVVPTAGAATLLVPVARVDEIVRLVGESSAAQLRLGRLMDERLGDGAVEGEEFRGLGRVLHDLQQAARRSRMVPVLTITSTLRRAVRDAARSLGKHVEWEVTGEATELDRSVLEQLTEPLLHLVRNAVDHGVESPEQRRLAGKPEQARVGLHAKQRGSEVVLTITDDGRGIDVERVREQARQRGEETSSLSDEECLDMIFRSGVSTSRQVTDLSGRGVGLDVVRTSLQRVRGRVEVHSTAGVGTEFSVQVPITLAMLPCLLVGAGGQRFAIPMHDVMTVLPPDVPTVQAGGRRMVRVGTTTVSTSDLAGTLNLPVRDSDADRPVVVVFGLSRRHSFRVDALLGQREVVVKGLSPVLPSRPVFIGASVEPDGSILLVLDTRSLVDRVWRSERPAMVTDNHLAETPRRQGNLLVVDDAITIRELQRTILERAGFTVRTACDGIEALEALAEAPADLVVTDVEMPRMDGFSLTESIRADKALANIAVLILTSLGRREDRERGLSAGADGYIVKDEFDETALLGAVDRLLGRPT